VIDGERIRTTEDHPFWSVTDQMFEDAQDLAPGEKVLAADGRVIEVVGLDAGSAGRGTAYNLTVDELHTYYVGHADVLVHNCGSAAKTVSADGIRFSQRSVNGAAEIEASMRSNGWVGDAIDVVRMPDGGLTSIDNTRLLAAKRAGIDVRASTHGFADPIPESMAGRFLSRSGAVPSNWGEAISNRIAGQGSMFSNRYPSGSPFTGWSGN
jgi:hypothetical protein